MPLATIGAPFIIDVNPNPYLSPDAEDVASAAKAGLSYQQLIGRIVENALGLSQASPHASQPLYDRCSEATSSGSHHRG